MKRFTVTNNANGMKFQFEALVLGDHQPEWGKHERWVRLGQEDINGAIATREILNGEETVTEYRLPAQYSIVETDITAELAAKQTRINAFQALFVEVRDFDITNATTVQTKAYLIKERTLVLKAILFLKKMLEEAE